MSVLNYTNRTTAASPYQRTTSKRVCKSGCLSRAESQNSISLSMKAKEVAARRRVYLWDLKTGCRKGEKVERTKKSQEALICVHTRARAMKSLNQLTGGQR
uniref:Uncharacterized protein n=1 Tax=Rhizophora mucronata TaxID=61149 RepID=A0A2P2JYM1_RHIMU